MFGLWVYVIMLLFVVCEDELCRSGVDSNRVEMNLVVERS